MAGNDLTIRAIIKLLVEGGHIPKDVAKSIDGVGASAKTTKKELEGLGSAGKQLADELKKFLGAAALGDFIKSSVEDFAKVQRAVSALGYTIRQLGLGTAADAAKIRDSLKALAQDGGAALIESLPAYQRFAGITHDLEAAMAATKLASDVAESGIVDFGTAVNGVVALLQGKAKLAANLFGLQLRETGDATKDNAALMALLQKQVGGLGDAFDDSENKINKLDATWADLKQTVGEGFAPAIEIINTTLFHAIGIFKDLGAIAGAAFDSMIGGATKFSQIGTAAFDISKLLKDPKAYWEAVVTASKAAAGSVSESWKVAQEQIVADHTKASSKIEDTEKGRQKLVAQAALASAEQQAKIAEHAAHQLFEATNETAQKTVQAQIEAAKDGSAERLALELQLLDLQEAAELEKVKGSETAKADVRAGFDVQRAATEKKFSDQRAEAELRAAADLARAKAELVPEGTRARLDADLEALHAEHKAAMESFHGTETEKATREAIYLAARLLKIREFAKSSAQAELDIYEELLQSKADLEDAQRALRLASVADESRAAYAIRMEGVTAQYDDELKQIDQQRLDAVFSADLTAEQIADIDQAANRRRLAAYTKFKLAEMRLDQQQATAAIDSAIRVSNTALALAQAAWGKSKAFAVAKIIVDTGVAIMNAWAHATSYWEGIVETVLISGIGAVQLSKVKSADPAAGAGFDDPVNDRMAYQGGRRWAKDWVDNTSAGFSEGIAAAMATPTKAPTAAAAQSWPSFSPALMRYAAPSIGGSVGSMSDRFSDERIVGALAAVKDAMGAQPSAGGSPIAVHNHYELNRPVIVDKRSMIRLVDEIERVQRNNPKRVR
jgi:hypothetical protein